MSTQWTKLRGDGNSWVQEDNNWKANFPIKAAGPGINTLNTKGQARAETKTMVAVVNPTTGAYDISQADIFGRRTPVYSYNPETGQSTPYGDGTLFNKAFTGKAGQAQLNNLNTLVKKATLDNLERHTETLEGLGDTPRSKLAQKYLSEIQKKGAYKSLANTAEESDDDDTNDDGGGGGGNDDSTDDPANGGGDGTNSSFRSKSAAGTRDSNFGDHRFPSDLGNSTMDVIKFNMVKFNPRKFTDAGDGLQGLKDRAKGEIIGSVILPIPGGIQENTTVAFGDGNMTPLQAAGAKIMDAAFGQGGGIKGAGAATEEVFEKAITNEDTRKALQAYFTGQGIGLSVDQVLARTRGQVVNNNLELLFQGPVLRPFNFNFKLSPRDDTEAQSIRSIIRFFKQGMAPSRSQGNLFLKAPHMFEIEYITRGEKGTKHPSLNSFKTCACIGFAVNYTPDGTYNTFDDPGASMTAYDLRMQFKELDPVYNEDYGNKGNLPAEVGF